MPTWPDKLHGQSGAPGTTGTTYYWRVRGLNINNQAGPWSAVRKFVVDTTLPAAPAPTTPTDGAVITTAKPVLKWTAVTGAKSYQVDIDNQPCSGADFGPAVVTNAPAPTTSYTHDTSLAQGDYCWRAQAKDAAGNVSGESVLMDFTLNLLTGPNHQAVILTSASATTANVPLKWAGVTGATGYTLYLYSDLTCTTAVGGYPQGVGTVLTRTVTLAHGQYCWKVQAAPFDAAEPPTFRTFVVSPPAPTAPTLLTPAASGITNDNTPDFSWNATASTLGAPFTYDLQADNNGCTFPSPEITQVGLGTSYTPGGALADGVLLLAGTGSQQLERPRSLECYPLLHRRHDPSGSACADLAHRWAVITTAKPVLKWNAVTGAKSYQVDIDDQPCSVADFGPAVVTNAPATTTSYTHGTSLAQGDYCWRVQARMRRPMRAWRVS